MATSGPRIIATERDFSQFVKSFRGGTIVRDLIPDAPFMEPNADYYFTQDNVVAELKCLCTDVRDQNTLNRRFLSACERLGYSAEQALRIAFREDPLPVDVARAVVDQSLDHVRKALRKAGRQISATKRELGRADAMGLVIICNESNVSLTPVQLIQFMATELRALNHEHIDGVIYMTANLYYPVEQDDINRSLWLPGYRRVNTRLTSFVDDFGAE